MSISNWFVGALLTPQRVTAKQIHEEIYLSGDELLSRLNKQISEYVEVEADQTLSSIDRINMLEKLGFSNHPDMLNFKKHQNTLYEERQLIQEKKNKLMLIEEFNLLYPACKIVHFSDLQSICKKYGLQQAPAKYYQGTLPDKNLKEIHDFFENKPTKFSHIAIRETSRGYRDTSPISFAAWEAKKEYAKAVIGDYRKQIYLSDNTITQYSNNLTEEYSLEKRDLQICCLKKDLISSWKEQERLIELLKDDPIVFVRYGDFAIIISAWGAEAEDVAQL